MNQEDGHKHKRHARMTFRSTVLISLGSGSWTTEIENISATGVLVDRPEDWSPKIGEHCALDMLIDENLHVNLEATVVRISDAFVALAYSRIPEDRENALWSLLGRYADDLDQPR